MKMISAYLCSLFVVFVIACSQVTKVSDPLPVVVVPAASPTPVPAKTPPPMPAAKLAWAGKHKDSELWTKAMFEAITELKWWEVVPADISAFCPTYPRLSESDRMVFWAQLMSIMVKHESAYNPKSYYMEPPPLEYYSIGLFQLSYEDNLWMPKCKLDKAKKNLEDGVTNIKCAALIFNKYLRGHNRIAGLGPGNWKSAAAYWAVLRYDHKGKPREAFLDITSYTRGLSICK